jgi:hypothetical protein
MHAGKLIWITSGKYSSFIKSGLMKSQNIWINHRQALTNPAALTIGQNENNCALLICFDKKFSFSSF